MNTAAASSHFGRRLRARGAFTLIEIMVVVAIIGLVAGLAFVAVAKGFRRNALQQATEDIKEACRIARDQAIVHCTVMEVRFYPQDGRIETGAAPADVSSDSGITNAPPPMDQQQQQQTPEEAEKAAKARQPKGFSGHLPVDQLQIEMLDVNFREQKNADMAKVRFYANGTSDECTVILFFPDTGERRKITLELVTALPEITPF
jgi:prepilin-type N-terminal cleavage/methylation domain-containing protein